MACRAGNGYLVRWEDPPIPPVPTFEHHWRVMNSPPMVPVKRTLFALAKWS